MSPSILDPQSRELSSADALTVAFDFFRDFDRRVANQQLFDSHVVDSAKAGDAKPRGIEGESCSEGGAR